MNKKLGRPKSPLGRKTRKLITLSTEALKYLNSEAIRTNRSPSNVIETLLLQELKKYSKEYFLAD